MYDYYCRSCKQRFEAQLIPARCVKHTCQSTLISEIRSKTPCTYHNLEYCFELEGAKYEVERDRAGILIRNELFKYYEEIENNGKEEN